jgi:hypothetical protein
MPQGLAIRAIAVDVSIIKPISDQIISRPTVAGSESFTIPI